MEKIPKAIINPLLYRQLLNKITLKLVQGHVWIHLAELLWLVRQ